MFYVYIRRCQMYHSSSSSITLIRRSLLERNIASCEIVGIFFTKLHFVQESGLDQEKVQLRTEFDLRRHFEHFVKMTICFDGISGNEH